MKAWRAPRYLLALLCFIFSINVSANANPVADPGKALSDAALERTKALVIYDPAYVAIDYPNGDVPAYTGVCSDVVIRSYRKLGIDLQRLVHEDMRAHFTQYPAKRIWGQSKPDANIDHRRVPNLETYFQRQGASLAITQRAQNYLPGDVVSWMFPGNKPHIGIVVSQKSSDGTPLIVHNIGWGPRLENVLFAYPIVGHFRYLPKPSSH
ncbi:hypothetical protein VST7929_01643 [Vibrio stylophorae]|uniref:DUF1287 domain-containing protein n=2 Tax=Vibrio stylophorae TaxID=659351 RepID=A0ABM8ZTX4_9VIBR|nr:hypothetical protein VST7929_01643 [Vibrio stylophorae]